MASDRRRLAAPAWVLALLLAALPASAEPSKGEREAAHTLMDLGDRKVEAKDYPAALKAYQTADAIMGVPTTGIEVAQTLALMGRLVKAWEAASKVASFPRKAGEPEAFTRARAEGESLAGKLLPRIPVVQLHVEGAPPGAPIELQLDGEPLPMRALTGPLKVDPGHHEIVASLVGGSSARGAVTLGEGESSPLVIHLGAATKIDDPPGSEGGGRSPLFYVGLGVGGAGLLAGAITGALSLSRTAAIKRQCPTLTTCPPALQGDIDAANTLANVSNAGFAVAVAGAALAVVGLVISPRARAAPALVVELRSGAGGGTFAVSGRF
ncbi:MAG: hypothetical protein ABI193_05925 [Minicystis sp.]